MLRLSCGFRRVRKFLSRKKAPITFVICVYGSVCTSACVSADLTGRIFAKFDIGWGGEGSFTKISRKTLDLVKIGKKYRILYRKTLALCNVDRCAKYFVVRKQGKGTHCGNSKAKLNTCILLTATCTSTTIRREGIVVFPWRLSLGKHTITYFK
jgi:hypothetical protein